AGVGRERHLVADVEVATGAHPDPVYFEVANLCASVADDGQDPEAIPHVERVEQRENLGICHGSGSRDEARCVPARSSRKHWDPPRRGRSRLRVFPRLSYIALPLRNKSICYV